MARGLGRAKLNGDARALWPDLATARIFLQMMLGRADADRKPFEDLGTARVARWLVAQGLGPMAYARFKDSWPNLAAELRSDTIMAALEQQLQVERREQIHAQFEAAGIPLVLLKGGALSLSVYENPAWRPMSDIDIWVRDAQIPAATQAMRDAGFRMLVSEKRPLAIQKLVEGELQFADAEGGLVEVHWSPFTGWWLQGAAKVDVDGAWARLQRLDLPEKGAGAAEDGDSSEGKRLLGLCWEDCILQLAVHVSVGHKFGIWPVRSLVDIYLISSRAGVDWDVVVRRALAWRLATVTWMVLSMVDELLEMPELGAVLEALQPSRSRRRLLRGLMPLKKLLATSDMREALSRLGLLILLVDRPRDMARLATSIVWPDQAWLEARYGEGEASHRRHLWHLVRQRGLWG